MRKLDSISSIAKQYKYYIFDMSGVLTDGNIIFPSAIECLHKLQDNQKDVIVLSNSPRVPDSIRQKLRKVGLKIDKVVTSGGFLLSDVKKPKYFSNISGKCFKLGDNHNTIFEQEDAKFNMVQNIEDAEYILINQFLTDLSEFSNYEPILQQALKLNLICVCPNPDVFVYHGDKIIYPQGYFAKKYEEMGGEVFCYGKPYTDIYEYLDDLYGIDKSKSLMIGDNLFTDIKGANSYGIDSILITSGNHRNDNLEELIPLHGFTPNYLSSFVAY